MKTNALSSLTALAFGALTSAACTFAPGDLAAPSASEAEDPTHAGVVSASLDFSSPAVTVEIVGRGSGLCLDVEGVSTADGALVQLWGCGGGANQAFRLRPVGDGSYVIQASHSGKCLDVYGGDTGNFAAIDQYQCTGGTNQRFVFHKLASGDYQIRAQHSERCFNVVDFATHNGARIQQYDCNEDSNESFILRRRTAPSSRALVVLLENGGFISGLPANPSVVVPSFSCRGLVVSGVTSAQAAVDRFLRDRNLVGASAWYLQRQLGVDYTCVFPSNWSQSSQAIPAAEVAAPFINAAANTFTRDTVSAALGNAYDTVQFLEGSSMRPDVLRTVLERLAVGSRVDLHVLTHGSRDGFGTGGDIWFAEADVRKLGDIPGLDLRAVYQMSCYGSALRAAWAFAGADAVSGSRGINYAPSSYFDFIARWRAGARFSDAVLQSYSTSVALMRLVYGRLDLFDERPEGDIARSPAQVELAGGLDANDEINATAPDFAGSPYVTLR